MTLSEKALIDKKRQAEKLAQNKQQLKDGLKTSKEITVTAKVILTFTKDSEEFKETFNNYKTRVSTRKKEVTINDMLEYITEDIIRNSYNQKIEGIGYLAVHSKMHDDGYCGINLRYIEANGKVVE